MSQQRIRPSICILFLCAAAYLTWQTLKTKDSDSSTPSSGIKERASRGVAPAKKQRSFSRNNSVENVTAQNDANAAPVWAIKYGGEFWRRGMAEAAEPFKPANGAALVNPHFSLGDVIDRVDHALEPDSSSGLMGIRAGNYTARFDGQNLQFSPSLPAATQSVPEVADAQKEDALTFAGRPVADPATGISFHTVSVERDGTEYFSADRGTTDWSVMGNTAQALLSSDFGIVAHYESRNDGVAVTWVFPQALPGTGPMEVSARVDGLAYAGATDGGLHFADNNGTARVVIGKAVAVDAAGSRWALDTRYASDNSGTLVVELPAAVQAEAVYPLAIDPIIGPEFGMDAPVSSMASGTQNNAAIACAGNTFLAVWEDSRNSGNTGRDIYGARVSTNGTILDPLGLAICTAPADQTVPAIAANGTTFMVVWHDLRSGTDNIFGARVTSSGVVMDPMGIAISVSPNGEFNPAIAARSTNFFVVWEDNRNSGFNGKDIYGARVSTTGVVMDPLGFAVATNAADQALPTITTNSTGVFVAWQDSRSSSTNSTDIYGARVSLAGTVLDATGVPLSTSVGGQTEPAAAANGDTVLVAWRDRRTGVDDVYGTLVNFTNNTVNVFETNGLPISTAAGTQRSPAICGLSTNFLVVWRDRRNSGSTSDDIYGARVDTNGNVLDASGFIISNDPNTQTVPAVASNPSGALVVWTDSRNSNTGNDIYGARVSNGGLLVDTNGFAVSLSGAAETAPVVAFNGTNYLVVWQDDRSFTTNDTDIRGTRVSGAGAVLDLHGINICTLPAAQTHPSVAASGGEFLVAWEDSRNGGTTGVDIYGTRVSGAGTVMDPAGLALSTAANDEAAPAVAGNASTFLVTWEDNSLGSAPDIFGTLVSQGGTISNPSGFAISATGGNEIRPVMAANSNQFLVVWEDSGDVFAARVANNGTVLDPSGSAIQLAGQGSESLPSVAALGTNYLVAWQDSRNFSSDIYGARVNGDGSVPDFDGFPICTLPTDQINPAVAANADTWLVVWQNKGVADGTDLYSARVSVMGSVLDFSSVPLLGSADRMTPQLAYGGAGKFLLVSQGFRTNSLRIAANLMTAEPASLNSFVQFTANNYPALESSKVAKVTVALAAKFSGEVTVDFSTTNGTATAGVDYMPVSGRLVFSAKKLSTVISIPLINDLAVEPNKTITVTLQNPMGGALLGPRATATVTIME